MRIIAIIVVLLAVQTPLHDAANLARAGDLSAAERAYTAILQADPNNPRAHYNLGTVLARQSRYEDARPHLEAAARESYPPVAAAYNLGNTDLEPAHADSTLAERDQRLRRAIESYKQALLESPGDVDAKWNLELARRLLEQDPAGGGGGGGGGGQGPPSQGDRQPSPTSGGGSGQQPRMSETEAESLLRDAQEREMEVQRDRLMKPQPPGPIRP